MNHILARAAFGCTSSSRSKNLIESINPSKAQSRTATAPPPEFRPSGPRSKPYVHPFADPGDFRPFGGELTPDDFAVGLLGEIPDPSSCSPGGEGARLHRGNEGYPLAAADREGGPVWV